MLDGQLDMLTRLILKQGADSPHFLVRDISNFLERPIHINVESSSYSSDVFTLAVDVYKSSISRRHLLINEFKYILMKEHGLTQGDAAAKLMDIAKMNGLSPAGRSMLFGNTLTAWGDGVSVAKVWGIKAAMIGLIEQGYSPQNSTIRILMAHAVDLLCMDELPSYILKDNPTFPTLVELVKLGRNVFYKNEK
ncbi:hypothetical protein ACLHZ0_20140 [Aeromonas salmonicida]|uniref:hypothetical protein n=1 Tax=Aeromonas salmonicida TaxID=645 RepID=UPI003CFDA2E3